MKTAMQELLSEISHPNWDKLSFDARYQMFDMLWKGIKKDAHIFHLTIDQKQQKNITTKSITKTNNHARYNNVQRRRK